MLRLAVALSAPRLEPWSPPSPPRGGHSAWDSASPLLGHLQSLLLASPRFLVSFVLSLKCRKLSLVI